MHDPIPAARGSATTLRLVADPRYLPNTTKRRTCPRTSRICNPCLPTFLLPISPAGHATKKRRQQAFVLSLSELLKLPDNFEGSTLENDSRYEGIIQDVFIVRGQRLVGPLFHPSEGTSIGDPTVQAIKGKFAKAATYKTTAPIELLAYVDRNAMFPDDVCQPNLEQFVAT